MKAAGPLKRHPALVPLPQQHHHGLLMVWKIRQGLRPDIEFRRIRKYILFFGEQDLQEVFHEFEMRLQVVFNPPWTQDRISKTGLEFLNR